MIDSQDSDSESIIVAAEEAELRLDKFLTLRYPDQSRTYFQYLIEKELVLVNGQPQKKRTLVQSGDEIEVEFALTPEISLQPEDISLDIVYEDDDILAINKAAGMVVHPAIGNWTGTFVNALLFHCKQLDPQNSLRPGIVHRLDKETSGILLAAKNEKTQQALVQLFAQRQIKKEYIAICCGNPGKCLITKNIGRHPTQRKKMTVVEEGKEATTECETLFFNDKLSVVKLFPKTGRTHQLRVHLQSIGHPILGDSLYGIDSLNKKYQTHRQLLHAHQLHFKHPSNGKPMHLVANIPADLEQFIQKIR